MDCFSVCSSKSWYSSCNCVTVKDESVDDSSCEHIQSIKNKNNEVMEYIKNVLDCYYWIVKAVDEQNTNKR